VTIHKTELKISNAEFQQRCEKLLAHVEERGASGVILFDRDYLLYYAGFAFIPTERPMAFVMNKAGQRALFVPRLEAEHAKSLSIVDHVEHYIEYPDIPHPFKKMLDMFKAMNISGDVLADNDGYPWIFGYRGPALTERGYTVHNPRVFIEDQMMVKSPAEIELIRESCKWGNLAHMLLQKYTKVGVTETYVEQRASNEASLAMMDTLGPIYRSQSMYNGAFAGYRGQIGRNSGIPHALANNMTFQEGDVLVTGAAAGIWGYLSELERTMILGKPNDQQKRYFDHMLALQDLALELIEPGKLCSAVDTEIRLYFKDHDLTANWRHHTGHTIGIRYHEGPFLDIGDDTPILPGMIFTVEPGVYVPELGGFRHSDTVVVVDDGIEMLTYYPRDLESLTLPV
jgi:Xaa-Pro dipeptidase